MVKINKPRTLGPTVFFATTPGHGTGRFGAQAENVSNGPRMWDEVNGWPDIEGEGEMQLVGSSRKVGCPVELSMAYETPKDLEFIRQHVKEWPDGARRVYLSLSGEVCFFTDAAVSDCALDFYPDALGASHAALPCPEYTREQWAGVLTVQGTSLVAEILADVQALTKPVCNLHESQHCPKRHGEHCTSTKPCRNKETTA